ncbi:hypothetical protein HW445_29520, partial [Streptomyces sp. UH6]|nr:hypothetical protein [Streptomyces sp. UH6]
MAMEAGPRDTAHGRHVAEGDRERGDDAPVPDADLPRVPTARTADDALPDPDPGPDPGAEPEADDLAADAEVDTAVGADGD